MSKTSENPNPFFSIGITTYNREAFLKECLESILSQPFQDFEIIVGNDYVAKPISTEGLGIQDARVKIVNYPENKGEYGNLNWLCNNSKGRYFTWLADDDLQMPWCLSTVHSALESNGFPVWLFTSYFQGNEYPSELRPSGAAPVLYSGERLFELIQGRALASILIYGFFEKAKLKKPGVDMLSPYAGKQLYGDPQISLMAAPLDKVCFINEPLVFFRTHSGSTSYTGADAKPHIEAQEALLEHAVRVLAGEKLRKNFDRYMAIFLYWRVEEVFSLFSRMEKFDLRLFTGYIRMIGRHVGLIRYGRLRVWRRIGWIFTKIFLRKWRQKILFFRH